MSFRVYASKTEKLESTEVVGVLVQKVDKGEAVNYYQILSDVIWEWSRT